MILTKNEVRFEHYLDELIRGSELKASTIQGAWTHRINHKKKEIPKLQISLSESPFTTELTFETEVNAAGLLQGRA